MSADKKFPIREDILANLLSAQQWLRICLMVLFGLVSWVVRIAQIIVAIIQAIFALVTGYDNVRLREAGKVAALYQAQIWLYLTYVSDTRPFPFNDLPDDAGDLDFTQAKKPDYSNPDEVIVTPAPSTTTVDDSDEDVFSDMSFTSSSSVRGEGHDDKDDLEDDDFDTSDDDNRNPQT